MQDWLSRFRFPVTSVVLLVVPLFLMYFHGRGTGGSIPGRLSAGLAGLVQEGVNAGVEGVAGVLRGYVFLIDVEAENERLKVENERLMQEALQTKRLAVENQGLRSLLRLRQDHRELAMTPAVVVGRGVTPFFRVSRISIQAEGKVAPVVDSAVITPHGLLGRIVSVVGGYADVMLLSDSRSRVAGEVLGRGVLGMVIGTGRTDEYQARLQVSLTEAPLEKDAVVVTSGHDRVFPRGIEVGYIADPSDRRQVGAYLEYDVTLAVNPALVDDAMVVLGPGAPAEPGERTERTSPTP